MQKNWLIININKKYFLKVGNKVFDCQIGERGLNKAVKKTEGDKTTPIGNWHLKKIFYQILRLTYNIFYEFSHYYYSYTKIINVAV